MTDSLKPTLCDAAPVLVQAASETKTMPLEK